MPSLGKFEAIRLADPSITEEDITVVAETLRKGGEDRDYYYAKIEEFESQFAAWHGRKHGIMTPNGTSAIHLALACIGVSAGDEVIVPECTWIASAAPVVYQRAKPVFADIDKVSWCLTRESITSRITTKTKAVVVVDLFGNMPEMLSLRRICDDAGILLVEDAAQALGSKYQGTRAGKFGVASIFSFHRTKTISTGEGGILLLDDDRLYQRGKVLRDMGRPVPGSYNNKEIAFKYWPSLMQAALGQAQFRRIDELIERKRWIWKAFQKHLADVPDITLNSERDDTVNGAWCTALVFGESHKLKKETAIERLTSLGLPVRPFYYPLSSLQAFHEYSGDGAAGSPIAYDVSDRAISLPCAFSLTEEQIAHYSKCIRSLLNLQ